MSDVILPAGQVFAERYRIQRLLARGGFGAVYVAEQLATEAEVALKILWPHVLGSETAVASFQQEARIAGRLRSAHIVRVVDAGIDRHSSMPYLAMELLEGQNLDEVVEGQGPLTPELVVTLMRQLASALDKAHGFVDREGVARPIVHRDLKPENLFLTRSESGEPVLKVLDFGIAKIMSASANLSREVKGTPLYMAYEQAAGGRVTPATDVWALGLIVFFLFTGKSYWKSVSSAEQSLTHLFAEVITLPIVAPSMRLSELHMSRTLPAGFDGWFLRCVEREPTHRFESAGRAVAALAHVCGLGPPPESLASEPAAAMRLISPQPTWPTLESAGANTGHSLSVTQLGRSKRRGGMLVVLGLLGLALTGVAGAVALKNTPRARSSAAQSSTSSVAVQAAELIVPPQPPLPLPAERAAPSAPSSVEPPAAKSTPRREPTKQASPKPRATEEEHSSSQPPKEIGVYDRR